ncbi:MAG: polyribonucleotide nucleotidyltransferase, partial [Patescibacteria group bacterium]
MQTKKYEIELNGQKLIAEFTDLAENAHGSVLLRYGNTTVFATAVMSKGEKEADYFPLSVEYEERFYAAGQILGSRFMRREGRPSDEAILSGRITDRTIRPLFDQNMRNEVQVVVTILSLDEYDPDILGVIASSLALGTSNIPWGGPVGAVRIGKNKDSGEFIINPTYKERGAENYELDLIACGKDNTINMIEVGANEVSEETLVKAMEKAKEKLQKIQDFQQKIIGELGKKKTEYKKATETEELKKLFAQEILPILPQILGEAGKKKIYELEDQWFTILDKSLPGNNEAIKREARFIFHEAINDFVHKVSLEEGKRIDGRGFDELRPLYAQAGKVSPVLHGSGIFYRGGTHIFSALTLGAPGDSQVIDGMELQTNKRFMHHYNFPPFSVGETGRIGSTNRRMIGHGALAEKALLPVIPKKETFPYTIRIVSEALSSNGSTSMGSVCAATLALMDAGVPISKPVAGIASGLMLSREKYKILTDIQGPEDEHGDMD